MKFMKMFFAAMLTLILIVGMAYAETDRLGEKSYSFNPTNSVTKTAAYTLTTSDSLVNVTNASANIVITLPTVASCMSGMRCQFKILKTDATTYDVIVTPATGDTIGGESTRYLVNQNSNMVIHAGPGRDWTVDFESPYALEDHESGSLNIGTVAHTSTLVFEGATADDYETTLSITDPTADRTVTTPDSSGTIAYVGGDAALVSTLTTSTTFTSASCGKTYLVATDVLTHVLPDSIADCTITVINTGANGNNTIKVDTDANDTITGTCTLASSVVSIAGSAGDSVTNTKSTAIKGDLMTFFGTGSNAWIIKGCVGIWADTN
jgi:hypothetical protein